MVSPQSTTTSTTLRESRRRLHRQQDTSTSQTQQMDQREMAHQRRQASPTGRRHHTLFTRRSMEQTQPIRKSRNQPKKDRRLQAGQAICAQHTSRKNSRPPSPQQKITANPYPTRLASIKKHPHPYYLKITRTALHGNHPCANDMGPPPHPHACFCARTRHETAPIRAHARLNEN